jgi:hypothetical protein
MVEALQNLPERRRVLLAFLIAPMVPALILTLPAALQGDSTALTLLVHYAKVSYCATLLIAVPAHFLLRKWHTTFISVYVGVGAAMGLAVFALTLFSGAPARVAGVGPGIGRLLSLPVDVIAGVSVLICFWLITRPDRE